MTKENFKRWLMKIDGDFRKKGSCDGICKGSVFYITDDFSG